MAGPYIQAAGSRSASASAETLSPSKPTVNSTGGALIALVSSKNNAIHGTATAGWSLIGQVDSGSSFTASIWIAAEGAAAPTFTWTGAAACAAQIVYIVATDTDIDLTIATTTSNTGNTSTHSTSSINTTRDNSVAIYIDAAAANTVMATPAGWTESVDNGSATDTGRFIFGYKQMPTSGGATGAISVTGAAADWVQWQIEVMAGEADGFQASKLEVAAWLDVPDGFQVSKIEVGAWIDDDPAPPPTSVSQAGMYGLLAEVPVVRASQGGIYSLVDVGVEVRASQAGMYSLTAITADVRVTQAGMYALGAGAPCVSQWCQIWQITRADGEEFLFTSLDRDFEFLGRTYLSCDSLQPSASEHVSNVDQSGSMDLSGAIGENGITTKALFSGLFDGALVEAWLVPWQGDGQMHRLLRGTFGPIEQSPTGFKVDLMGDGAKLMQTPLIRLIQPDCRWVFGGPHCQKDLTGLIVTGTVDSGVGQRQFTDAARAETPGYFRRGRVTFTSGLNIGISAEIKEHESGGVFTLWPRLQFRVAAGDQYSMEPGCSNLIEMDGGTNGCEAWDNLRRYGGFRQVPGGDRRNAAANVKPPGPD